MQNDMTDRKEIEEIVVRGIGRYSYPAVFGLPCIDANLFIKVSEGIAQAILDKYEVREKP